MRSFTSLLCLLLIAACGDDSSPADTSADDGGVDAPDDGAADGSPDAYVGCAPDAAADAGPPPEIEVTYADGTIVGRTIERRVHTFLGLPYAAPPVGDLRWQSPQPVTPWTSPRDASELSAECSQSNPLTGSVLEGEEDCLYLNVFTPDVAPAEPMPVMVWFHGGAFIFGQGGKRAGRLAAVADLVVVSVNYRLNNLGFLAHPALTAEGGGTSGNYGLLDQRAALEWVRDNIDAFGCDPESVTIEGESAGAVSITFHAVSPGSAGLFQRAIVESGPPEVFSFPTLAEAEAKGDAVATRLGCTDDSTVLACMRAASIEDLVAPADIFSDPGGLFYQTELGFPVPNIDGVVLPDDPMSLYRAGSFEAVPFLVGSNGDEGTLFHTDLLSTPVADEAEYRAALGRYWPDAVDAIVAEYPVASFANANAALTAVTGALFNCATRRFARAVSDAGAPTWLYAFEAVPEGGVVGIYDLGAFHSAELPYVFDYDGRTLGKPSCDQRDLVEAMQGYWSSFISRGDPNGGALPTWPAYDTAGDQHMLLASPPMAGSGYLEAECDFWDTVLDGA